MWLVGFKAKLIITLLSSATSVQYFPDSPSTDDNGYAASITKNPLRPIFENVYNVDEGAYMLTNDTWRIHDPSSIVEIDGILTLFATGKETMDGYPCAIESWYMFPGETGWRPGNCIWTTQSDRPDWWDEELGTGESMYGIWAPGVLNSQQQR